jgi:hypothetical protein
LDDKVADARSEAGRAFRRIVDQLDRDELVARQLEHAQAAERCFLDRPDDRAAHGRVERE